CRVYDAAQSGNDRLRLRPGANLVGQPAYRSLLHVGNEELRRWLSVQIGVERVSADSNDLDRAAGQYVAVAAVHFDGESTADRILIGESSFRETLVNNTDL